MTQTAERRPVTRPTPTRRARPSVLLPGAVSALWALGAGLVAVAVPVLLVWAADSRSGSGAADATRAAGHLWLLAHHAVLGVPGGSVGLTPLGLTLLPLALLHRAGRHGARSAGVVHLRDAVGLVAATAFPYAVAAGFVAALARTDAVQPHALSALLGGAAVAAVGAGSGVARETRLHLLAKRLPERLRRSAVAGSGAVAVLLAGGSLLVAGSLLTHLDRASSLASATDPGVVGGVALLLLGLLLVPNAAVWGAAFVAGPGFAVGAGTSVGPFATTLGSVPALPLLAALPGGDVRTWLLVVVLLVPVLAGIVAGVLTWQRLDRTTPWRAAGEAALAGPAAGVLAALLGWVSGGPVGGGRLVDVGPDPLWLALAVTVATAVPAAATAAICAHRHR